MVRHGEEKVFKPFSKLSQQDAPLARLKDDHLCWDSVSGGCDLVPKVDNVRTNATCMDLCAIHLDQHSIIIMRYRYCPSRSLMIYDLRQCY